jgi:hypothetical protein
METAGQARRGLGGQAAGKKLALLADLGQTAREEDRTQKTENRRRNIWACGEAGQWAKESFSLPAAARGGISIPPLL